MLNEVKQARTVVGQLQDWISSLDETQSIFAGLVQSQVTISVYINEVCCWESRCNDIDQLTFEYCQKVFQDKIECFRPFLRKR